MLIFVRNLLKNLEWSQSFTSDHRDEWILLVFSWIIQPHFRWTHWLLRLFGTSNGFGPGCRCKWLLFICMIQRLLYQSTNASHQIKSSKFHQPIPQNTWILNSNTKKTDLSRSIIQDLTGQITSKVHIK